MISFKDLGNQGRLCNQLFQIAAVVALAVRNNDKYVFPPWTYENDFNLHNCFSNHITNTDTYIEPHFHYTPISYRPTLNLYGFYQTERYFEDCQDLIRRLLTPKIGYGIKYNTTSIHVRRGDYLNFKKEYVQLDMNYYKAAMNVIQSKHYIVFSDDIPWCKTKFIGPEFTFAENNSAVTDLALQVSCANNIIANSSYSWWGAWLGNHPDKIVVAPKKWFGPSLSYNNTKDLYLPQWLLV